MGSLNWKLSAALTVNNIAGGGAVAGAVPIALNRTSAASLFASAASNGSDIFITKADGVTPLPFWIESFNATAQLSRIWVNIASVAAGSTEPLIIWYANSALASALGVSAQSSFVNTFSLPAVTAATLGMYQFNEGTGTTIHDTRGNGYNLSTGGTVTWNTSSGGAWNGGNYSTGSFAKTTFPTGSQLRFDGATGYAQALSSAVFSPSFAANTAGTVRCWINIAALPTGTNLVQIWGRYFSGSSSYNNMSLFIGQPVVSGTTALLYATANNATTNLGPTAAQPQTASPLDLNRDYLVTATWQISNAGVMTLELWINDERIATSTGTPPSTGTAYNFIVGASNYNGTPSRFFNGSVWGLELTNTYATQAETVSRLQFRPTYSVSTGYEKLTRYAGNPIITPLSGNPPGGDQSAFQEPSVVANAANNELLLYVHDGWNNDYTIIEFTSPVNDGLEWTRTRTAYTDSSNLGPARWHIPTDPTTNLPITDSNGNWLAFYDDSQASASSSHGICLCTSPPPAPGNRPTWTKYGTGPIIANSGTGTGIYQSLTGPAVTYDPVTAQWYMLAANTQVNDGTDTVTSFITCLYTATSPYGPWTASLSNPLQSLQVGSGMYGAYQLFKVGGRFVYVYHAAIDGLFCTNVRVAFSDDCVNWQQVPFGPILQMNNDVTQEDQIGDPWMFQVIVNGAVKTIVLFDSVNNANGVATTFAATYSGSIASLLSDVPLMTIGNAASTGPAIQRLRGRDF